jgi:excisionase family DNA binding protein
MSTTSQNNNDQSTATALPRLLRGKDVAAALNVSRALAYRWMQQGKLPIVRISGARTVRVPEDALSEWIRANTVIGAK